MSSDERIDTGEADSEQFYVGSRANLSQGDLIEPVRREDPEEQRPMKPFVYLTTDQDAAIWEAEVADGDGPARVYVVRPLGPIMDASDLVNREAVRRPWMTHYSYDALRVENEITEWRLYHGTRADLGPGDLIEPGQTPNFGDRTKATKYVYLTRTLDAAKWGAELASGEGPGRIHIVEPTGPIEDDPNLTNTRFRGNPTQSFRSQKPLLVTGELMKWQGHSPESIRAMKEGLKRLEKMGIEPIDD